MVKSYLQYKLINIFFRGHFWVFAPCRFASYVTDFLPVCTLLPIDLNLSGYWPLLFWILTNTFAKLLIIFWKCILCPQAQKNEAPFLPESEKIMSKHWIKILTIRIQHSDVWELWPPLVFSAHFHKCTQLQASFPPTAWPSIFTDILLTHNRHQYPQIGFGGYVYPIYLFIFPSICHNM